MDLDNPVRIQTSDAVVGYFPPSPLAGTVRTAPLGTMVATCCEKGLLGPLQILDNQSLDIAMLGMRGQTQTGGHVINETSGYELGDYVNDIRLVQDSLRTPRTGIFGYSHGGYFAVRYALSQQARVQSLVLVEPALYTDPGELNSRAEMALAGAGVESLKSMIQYVGGTPEFGAPPDQYAAQIREDYQNDFALAQEWQIRAGNPIEDAQLSLLSMPVLLIGGTNSAAAFMVERAAARIPRATVWWVQGADHFSLMSDRHAEELAAIIQAFTASAAPGVAGS